MISRRLTYLDGADCRPHRRRTMGSAMKKVGGLADSLFQANDKASLDAGAMGVPPSPVNSAMATAGDAVNLVKSGAKIAEPGPAPNSAWGNALISGGKLALSIF